MHPFAQATPLSTTPVSPTSFQIANRKSTSQESWFGKTPNLADTIHQYALARVDLADAPSYDYSNRDDESDTNSFENVSHLALRYLSSPDSAKTEQSFGEAEGTFSRKQSLSRRFMGSGLATKLHLLLHRQNGLCAPPTYGRKALIEGVLLFDPDESVLSVEARIEGRINFHQTDADDRRQIVILSDRLTLWKASVELGSLVLPFRYRLPSTYMENNRECPLPPSFEAKLSGLPGFTVSIQYSICVSVTRKRTAYWPLERSSQSITPFKYRPRVVAPSPTSPRLTTQNSKVHQFFMTSRTSAMESIACTLYLPSSAVWPLHQPIPFQLRMTSDIQSLSSFVCNSHPQLPVPNSFLNLSEEPESRMKAPKLIASTLQFPDIPVRRASVRLFIARRVALNPHIRASVPEDVGSTRRSELRGMLWKMIHCGEARFGRRTMGENSISWRGEIPLAEELATPGFVANRLSVEDCLILSISPPDELNSGLQTLRAVIPMQFVTDAFREGGRHGRKIGVRERG